MIKGIIGVIKWLVGVINVLAKSLTPQGGASRRLLSGGSRTGLCMCVCVCARVCVRVRFVELKVLEYISNCLGFRVVGTSAFGFLKRCLCFVLWMGCIADGFSFLSNPYNPQRPLVNTILVVPSSYTTCGVVFRQITQVGIL